jgi:hypothetical protein
MGESISWFAIKGLDKETIYRRARLTSTGAVGDYAGGNGARQLPGGWTLIVLGRVLHPLISSAELQKLSADCELIACNVEEHVMASSSEAWKEGNRIWRLEHQGDERVDHLECFGHLPKNFAQIEKECRDLQEKEDHAQPEVDFVFEIPLKLAQSITGFKHDEGPVEAFELLDWHKPKPWWQIW